MWLTGPAAPRHVGSSQTRARTRVPCIGRQILNHCATREAPKLQLFKKIIYLFIFGCVGSSLLCVVFSSCGEWGLLFAAVSRLLIAVASLCCGAPALGARASVVVARGLYSAGSGVVAPGLTCSVACGIFPD